MIIDIFFASLYSLSLKENLLEISFVLTFQNYIVILEVTQRHCNLSGAKKDDGIYGDKDWVMLVNFTEHAIPDVELWISFCLVY